MLFSLVSRAARPKRWSAALLRAPSWKGAECATCYNYNRSPSPSSIFSRSGSGGTVVRFKDLSFGHNTNELLTEVDFSIEEGSKVTIMGQNGSGKSTIIKLLSKKIYPDEGQVVVKHGETVACAMQTMPTTSRELTVKAFFADQLNDDSILDHELEAKMARALQDVLLEAPGDRIIKSFSGGQQARLLLAAALIQNPTILLLDEPTNNLDPDGLWHLQNLIQQTDKTCVVISHDEDFLNSFTDQVLYLDIFSKKVETYLGDYWFVKTEIEKRIKRENALNAQLKKKSTGQKGPSGQIFHEGRPTACRRQNDAQGGGRHGGEHAGCEKGGSRAATVFRAVQSAVVGGDHENRAGQRVPTGGEDARSGSAAERHEGASKGPEWNRKDYFSGNDREWHGSRRRRQ
mmetsp:Transcript_10970/g.19384  ORF Transcript_10970/g.19384 Transcript_10970/m.19384 type:complete len:402 (+) Transcript_10970:90-1295(+)